MEDGVKSKDDLLGSYRTQILEYIDNTIDEREEAELHTDYVDGKQYTEEEIQTLKARGQPIITDNKIKDKVEYMEGVERRTRTDPKAFPRTKSHDTDAEVATDAIRYVFDDNRFPQVKSAVFSDMLVKGMGGCEVIVDKDDPTQIRIRKIRWDRIYRDPYSMEPDFSDAMYRGIITWMDVSRAKEKWPDKAELIDNTMSQAPAKASGDTTDDKPRWADTRRKRVQVFEHYEGIENIQRSVFVWGGFLEEPKECAYVDDEGEHDNPMILASAYVDREGRRYGVVKRYISLQDEVNKRRSKSLHLLNSVQIVAEKGAVDDIKTARDQVHKPDGYVERNPGLEFVVERHLDLSAAHFQLLTQAEAALSVTGPNAALQGQSGSLSGRAKELDQQGGAIQIGPLFDSIRDWQQRVARSTWYRIKQYWDGPMWIRVTDDENGLKFVEINKPMTYGELEAEKLKGQPPEMVHSAVRQISMMPNAQVPAVDANGQPVIRNQVAKLDVDIIIDEAPDVVTIQAEEFQKLAELAKAGIPIPPDVLIEASQIRNKKQLLDKMSGKDDPMAQQRAQMMQIVERLEIALKAAEVRSKEAQALKDEVAAKEGEIDAAVKVATFISPEPQAAAKTQVGVN